MVSKHSSRPAVLAAALALVLTAVPAFAAGRQVATATKPSKTAAHENVEERITQLHKQLRITPEQEPAFNNFAQVMRDNAARMKELHDARARNEASMTAVDELNTYASVLDSHADGLHKLVPAFQALYEGFSPEQKKTADAVFHERIRAAAERHKR